MKKKLIFFIGFILLVSLAVILLFNWYYSSDKKPLQFDCVKEIGVMVRLNVVTERIMRDSMQ